MKQLVCLFVGFLAFSEW